MQTVPTTSGRFPNLLTVCKHYAWQNLVCNVPSPSQSLLDFTSHKHTPDGQLKRCLLSDQPNTSVILLQGHSGSGKSVAISFIAHDRRVRTVFHKAIWLIQLSPDLDLPSFLDHLFQLVSHLCSQNLHEFVNLVAHESAHPHLMQEIVSWLGDGVLIIIEDVHVAVEPINFLLKRVAEAVRQISKQRPSSLKLLMSSNENHHAASLLCDIHIPNILTDDADMQMDSESDEEADDQVNHQTVDAPFANHKAICIFRHSARTPESNFDSALPRGSHSSADLFSICCNLSMTVSLAGASVLLLRQRNNNCSGRCGRSTKTPSKLWRGRKNLGCVCCAVLQCFPDSFAITRPKQYSFSQVLQASLKIRDLFDEQGNRMSEVISSLAIFKRRTKIPLHVLEKLWQKNNIQVEKSVSVLTKAKILTCAEDGDHFVIHDLIHEEIKSSAERTPDVHRRFVEAYFSIDEDLLSVPETRQIISSNEYLKNNLVWHLSCGGQLEKVRQLVMDYRWIQIRINEGPHIPFHPVISDLLLLRARVEQETNDARPIQYAIDVLVDIMHKYMVPLFAHHRQYAFQLYGRLSFLKPTSNILRALIASIIAHADRPWLKPSAGMLHYHEGLEVNLKRKLSCDLPIAAMEVLPDKYEFVMVATRKEARILSLHDGRVNRTLTKCPKVALEICADKTSDKICFLFSDGTVLLHYHDRGQNDVEFYMGKDEKITCVEGQWGSDRIILGVSSTRNTSRLVLWYYKGNEKDDFGPPRTGRLNCLTCGGGSGEYFASSSSDHVVCLWKINNKSAVKEITYPQSVKCIVMRRDEKLIACAVDCSVHVWNNEQDETKSANVYLKHKKGVESIIFNNEGNMLYAGSHGEILVWDVGLSGDLENCQLQCKFVNYHMDSVTSLRLSSDGKELYANSYNHHAVYVWHAQFRQIPVEDQFANISAFGVSADGNTIVLHHKGPGQAEDGRRNSRQQDETQSQGCGLLEICDIHQMHDAQARCSVDLEMIHRTTKNAISSINRIAVSSDQKWVAFTSREMYNKLYVFDVVAGRRRRCIDVAKFEMCAAEPARPIVTSIAFTADSCTLVFRVCVYSGYKDIWRSSQFQWDFMNRPSEPKRLDGHDARSERKKFVCCKRANFLPQRDIDLVEGDSNSDHCIASLQQDPHEVAFSHDMNRMWILWKNGGLHHIDLMEGSATEFVESDLSDSQDSLVTAQPGYEVEAGTTVTAQPTNVHANASHSNPAPTNLCGDNNKSEREVVKDIYDVYISYDGSDKLLAEELYRLLVALGYKVFLDIFSLKPGHNAAQERVYAMETTKAAVVILSPEYAAQKLTMREVYCFLRRFRKARKDRERAVIIIPVFYRLHLQDCVNFDTLFSLRDENGESLFKKESLFKWVAEEGGSYQDILNAFQSLRYITGIENRECVTNGQGGEEVRKRASFAKHLSDAVVAAMP